MPNLKKTLSPLSLLKYGIKFSPVGVLTEVLIDFFDAEPVAGGTVPHWALKPESIEPIPNATPSPIQTPKNRVKPAPRRLYTNLTIELNPLITFPDIPKRKYQNPINNSSDTTFEYKIQIEEGLSDRTFGCLLARPYFTEPIPWCDPEIEQNFWQNLLSETTALIEEIVREIAEDKIKDAAKLAFLLLPLPKYLKPIAILGIEAITRISEYYNDRNAIIDNYAITGLLGTGGITKIPCPPLKIDPESEPFELTSNSENSECCIPLSLYDDKEGGKGTQIHILFNNPSIDNGKRKKELTIPFCKDELINYTVEEIKAVLPTSLNMGKKLHQIKLKNINSDGYSQVGILRTFATYNSVDDQESFLDSVVGPLIDGFCSESVSIEGSFSKTFTNTPAVSSGTFFPYSVTLVMWNQEHKQWVCAAKWDVR